MTLDDLERLKRHSCRNKKAYGTHQKKMNEDRPILSEAKYMILVFCALYKLAMIFMAQYSFMCEASI